MTTITKITLDNYLDGRKTFKSLNISSNSTGLSDIVDIGGYSVTAINMSTNGWTNANLTFLGSPNSAKNLKTIRHSTAGTELAYVTTANRCLAVDSKFFEGIRYLQLRSGTQAAQVAQATTRTVVLGLTPVNPIS